MRRRPSPSAPLLALRAAAALALLPCLAAAPAPARADVLELADGRVLDGKVLQERDGFVWVKTLAKTEKVPVAQVRSRTPGVSPVERLETLTAQAEKAARDAEPWWELYAFCAEHPELAKEAKRALDRTLRIAPDHAEARDANGEARFEERWVRKTELARLEAEAERLRVKREWEQRLGVTVEVYRGQHWLIVDNTGERDLARRCQDLDDAYQRMCDVLGEERVWDDVAPAVTLREHEDYVRAIDRFQPAWQKNDAWLAIAKDPKNAGVWNHKPEPMQLRSVPSTGAEGMWAALVHMNAHVILWRLRRSVNPPAWLEEGLGAWVEIEVKGLQMAYCIGYQGGAKGRATTDRAPKSGKKQGDALSDAQSEYKEHCVRAVQEGSFPIMRNFLRMTIGEFGPPEEGASLGMVTWLVGKDPEAFKKLVRLWRAGGKEDDVWKEAYGFERVEDMEREWKAWVLAEW
jgi:hypothetical protein